MSGLAGKRILLVEDEFLIAATAADMLAELGATVVGPAASIADALVLADKEAVDAALLDVNVNGERVDPVAELLRRRNIPIVYSTGYGDRAFSVAQDAPILDKPYTEKQLAGALARALAGD